MRAHNFINTISACADYPAYNPAICLAGYIDVVERDPDCEYSDSVTSGILWQIRRDYDGLSLEFSVKIISLHEDGFMFWGVNAHAESAGVEELVKMLRILGFLTQTKVYLFWKKHQS